MHYTNRRLLYFALTSVAIGRIYALHAMRRNIELCHISQLTKFSIFWYISTLV